MVRIGFFSGNRKTRKAFKWYYFLIKTVIFFLVIVTAVLLTSGRFKNPVFQSSAIVVYWVRSLSRGLKLSRFTLNQHDRRSVMCKRSIIINLKFTTPYNTGRMGTSLWRKSFASVNSISISNDWLTVVLGYNWPIITNACSPERFQKLLRPKLC